MYLGPVDDCIRGMTTATAPTLSRAAFGIQHLLLPTRRTSGPSGRTRSPPPLVIISSIQASNVAAKRPLTLAIYLCQTALSYPAFVLFRQRLGLLVESGQLAVELHGRLEEWFGTLLNIRVTANVVFLVVRGNGVRSGRAGTRRKEQQAAAGVLTNCPGRDPPS